MTRATVSQLFLAADTAADLMTPNPVSIREEATAAEATRLLTQKGFSAAPVIDEAGRPVGVLSQADLLIHSHQPGGREGRASVRSLMTPVIFSVWPETPAAEVVRELAALKVHRLFVVDSDGVLVGVISTLDVVRSVRY
jgi:CBS-domain-containing membrane protein